MMLLIFACQVNVGFLIMTLVIMYRHLKKQEKKSKRDTAKYCGAYNNNNNILFTLSYRHWLKVIISLVIVMGIVWIGKIISLGFNNLVVSYIVTTFIACQGVIIFILLVPLSKQVCVL